VLVASGVAGSPAARADCKVDDVRVDARRVSVAGAETDFGLGLLSRYGEALRAGLSGCLLLGFGVGVIRETDEPVSDPSLGFLFTVVTGGVG